MLTGVDETHANPIRAQLEHIPELTSRECRDRVQEVSKVLRTATTNDDVWRTILDNVLAGRTPGSADSEIEADPKVHF